MEHENATKCAEDFKTKLAELIRGEVQDGAEDGEDEASQGA